MEGTHDLKSGKARLGLSPEELEQLDKTGEMSAFHPGTGRQVDIFTYSVMQPNGQDGAPRRPPSANFDPDGNLSIALPLRPGEKLVLPLTITHQDINPSFHTEYYFGKVGEKAGEIILAAAAPDARTKAKKPSIKSKTS